MTAASLRVQVVVYQNDPSAVRRCLQSLAAAARHARDVGLLTSIVCVIGDNSPTPVLDSKEIEDVSAELGAGGLDGFDYRHLPENPGFGAANNILSAGADCEYILFLNPDTYLVPRSLEELLATMSDDTIGIAEARQFPIEHPKAYDLETGDTAWTSGCCMLIRGSVFADVGGFDDSFFLYCEDVDLSWQVKQLGFRVCFVPQATVFHGNCSGGICQFLDARESLRIGLDLGV